MQLASSTIEGLIRNNYFCKHIFLKRLLQLRTTLLHKTTETRLIRKVKLHTKLGLTKLNPEMELRWRHQCSYCTRSARCNTETAHTQADLSKRRLMVLQWAISWLAPPQAQQNNSPKCNLECSDSKIVHCSGVNCPQVLRVRCFTYLSGYSNK